MLGLEAKLKILGLCKVRGSPNTKIGRKYGPTSLTLSHLFQKRKM
jgi:hypothetical protein